MHLNQYTTGNIIVEEQCVVGAQMNWETFWLNELLADAIDVQE